MKLIIVIIFSILIVKFECDVTIQKFKNGNSEITKCTADFDQESKSFTFKFMNG